MEEARHLDVDGKRWVFLPKEANGMRKIRVAHLTDAALVFCMRLAVMHPAGVLFRDRHGRRWTRSAE